MELDIQEELTMKLSGTQRCESGYLYIDLKGWYNPADLLIASKNQQNLLFHSVKGFPVLIQLTGKVYHEGNREVMLALEAIAHVDGFPKGTLHVSWDYDEQFFCWQ